MLNFVPLLILITILAIVVVILYFYLRFKYRTFRIVDINQHHPHEQNVIESMFSKILPSILIDKKSNSVFMGYWLYTNIKELIENNAHDVISWRSPYGYYYEIYDLDIDQLKSILDSQKIGWV